jgi:hypothetical protein
MLRYSPRLEANTMSEKKPRAYGAITAVVNDLLPRLQADPRLGRFWAHRGHDRVKNEIVE